MIVRFLLIFILIKSFVLHNNEVLGQLKFPSVDFKSKAPSSSSFTRYGEIPVDYSTGVPNIEIPIHNIKVGDIEIPIKITYHAGGIKVRDVAGEVGLGFSLQIGGGLASVVIGMDDSYDNKEKLYMTESEVYNAIQGATSTSQIASLSDRFRMVLNGSFIRDHFSDRFQYSLCTGESGVFRLDYLTGEPLTIPYRPIKIDYRGNEVDLISAGGYRHYFKRNIVPNSYAFHKVVSPHKNDSVTYHYNRDAANGFSWLDVEYSYIHNSQDIKIEEFCSINPGTCYNLLVSDPPLAFGQAYVNGGLVYTDCPLLDSIVSGREVLHFEYATGRLDDCYGIAGSYRKLTKITVRDRWTRKVSKKLDFNHSYFGTQEDKNRRLRLDKISVSGEGLAAVEKYEFGYYTDFILPNYPSMANLSTYNDPTWHVDYWGYYNGAENRHLFPDFLSGHISGFMHGWANMQPIAHYAKACVLNKKKYPIGGHTIFEYELNGTPTHPLGGLRIRKISSYPFVGSSAEIKEYFYHTTYSKAIVPAAYKWENPHLHLVHYVDTRRPLVNFWEYYEETKVFSKSMLASQIHYGSSVVYGQVTEVRGEGTSLTGKTAYNYEAPDSEDGRYPRSENMDNRYFGYYHSDLGNYVPRLLSRETYKYENGQYSLVETEAHSYQRYKIGEFNTGLSLSSTITLESWAGGTYDDYYVMVNGLNVYDPRGYLNTLQYVDTKAFQDAVLLHNTISRSYENGIASVEETTEYDYDVDYTLLTSKAITTSSGESIRDEYTYPFNYNTVPFTDMVTLNILNAPVIQSMFKNSNFLASKTTGYGYWGNGGWSATPTPMILPKQVNMQVGHVSQELIHYNRYGTNGNVEEVVSKKESPIVYLWAYKGQYPVAKIENATYSEVASVLGTAFINSLNSGNVTDADIRQKMDILRSHTAMRKAQVTSYTYKPLVGMTSMTDPKGITEYYEYDSFGRLSAVKDFDGNILKTYCYNYAGQHVDCSSMVVSDPIEYLNDMTIDDVFVYPGVSTGEFYIYGEDGTVEEVITFN